LAALAVGSLQAASTSAAARGRTTYARIIGDPTCEVCTRGGCATRDGRRRARTAMNMGGCAPRVEWPLRTPTITVSAAPVTSPDAPAGRPGTASKAPTVRTGMPIGRAAVQRAEFGRSPLIQPSG
jgi:hypothetical protein